MDASKRPFDPVFGAEIEFVVLVEKDKAFRREHEEFLDNHASRPEAMLEHVIYAKNGTRQKLGKAFSDGGLTDLTVSKLSETSLPEHFVIKPESGLKLKQPQMEETADVRLANGTEVNIHQKEYIWIEIEVNAPALRLGDPESFPKVSKALEIIASFPGVLVTQNCGLHVHVSDNGRDFNIETLRNFFFLIIVGQTMLGQFHSLDRLRNRTCCLPELLFKDHESCNSGPGDLVAAIAGIDTLENLIDFMRGGGKFFAFNFIGLPGRYHGYEEKEEKTNTIEFRQHCGTLDPTRCLLWIETVSRLLKVCYNEAEQGGDFFRVQLPKLVKQQDYNVISLLKDLKLDDVAERWQGKTYSHTDKDMQTIIKQQSLGFHFISQYLPLWRPRA